MGARKLEKGVNDLATTHPEIAEEWNYEANRGLKNKRGVDVSTPDKIMSGSSQRVSWKCKDCGYIWTTSVGHRVHGSKCPECTRLRFVPEGKSLLDQNPELAKEWNYELNVGLKDGLGRDISTPDKVSVGSMCKAWWTCGVCGFTWNAVVRTRNEYDGCPECYRRSYISDGNSLLEAYPDLAEEWDYVTNNGKTDGRGTDISTPDRVPPYSHIKVFWKCNKCNQSWECAISDRTTKDNGCPYCSGRYPITGKTDLVTTHPEIAKQWHPSKNEGLVDECGRNISTPDKISSKSSLKVWWECPVCGHAWVSSVSNRTRGNGCPCCSESKGEKNVRKVLEDNHIMFKEQYVFSDRFYTTKGHPLKDDFAILDIDGKVVATIEFHGQQHYEPIDFAGKGEKWAEEEFKKIQERDKIKSDYLKAHGIPQLIIPYWKIDDIELILQNFLQTLRFVGESGEKQS